VRRGEIKFVTQATVTFSSLAFFKTNKPTLKKLISFTLKGALSKDTKQVVLALRLFYYKCEKDSLKQTGKRFFYKKFTPS
jgi:hypothetical protein